MKNLIKWSVLLINEVIIMLLFSYKKVRVLKDTIILVRLDNIGDFIIWLHSLKNLKNESKNKKIILVCNKVFEELAIESKIFDEIIGIDVKKFNLNLVYKYKVLKKLRINKYEKLISPIYSRNVATEGIVKNILATEKVGINGDTSNITKYQQKFTNKNYTKLIEIESKNKMQLYINIEFFNKVFNTNYKIELYNWNKNKKRNNSYKNYCIFFLGASTIKKCWEVEKYAEIIKKIPKNLEILLCGGKQEKVLGEKIISLIKEHKIKNLIGKTNLIEVLKLIKESNFIVCNDTFAVHMAVMLRKKSICIVGGGHFGRFLPYPKELEDNEDNFLPKVIYKKMDCFGCNWKCKYNTIPYKCIKNIKVKDVIL